MIGRAVRLTVAALCLFGVGHAEPDKVLYELQERCAKQAADFFETKFGGKHHVAQGEGTMLQDYENHYNPRLNKCFFLYAGDYLSSNKTGFSTLQLYELNEHKQYGTFTSRSDCSVLDRACRSQQEWRELTKPFLED